MAKEKTKEISSKKTAPKVKRVTSNNDTVSKESKSKEQYSYKVLPYMEKISQYISCGVTEGQVCEWLGVGKTSWAYYKKIHPELTETVSKAKTNLKIDLTNRAYQVAMGYSYEETKTVEVYDADDNLKERIITKHKKEKVADAAMLQFLLINRFPTEFARDPHSIELKKQSLAINGGISEQEETI